METAVRRRRPDWARSLVAEMAAAGMDAPSVGRACGVSARTVRRWRSGTVMPYEANEAMLSALFPAWKVPSARQRLAHDTRLKAPKSVRKSSAESPAAV